MAPEVRQAYEANVRSTDEIREIFNIKSQTTLYKILKLSGTEVKDIVKKGLTIKIDQ